jgi:chromosome segregation ATPase
MSLNKRSKRQRPEHPLLREILAYDPKRPNTEPADPKQALKRIVGVFDSVSKRNGQLKQKISRLRAQAKILSREKAQARAREQALLEKFANLRASIEVQEKRLKCVEREHRRVREAVTSRVQEKEDEIKRLVKTAGENVS